MDPLIKLQIPTPKTTNPPVIIKLGNGTLYYSGTRLIGIKTPNDTGSRLALGCVWNRREKARIQNHFVAMLLDASWIGTCSEQELGAKAARLCSETYAQYARERIGGDA